MKEFWLMFATIACAASMVATIFIFLYVITSEWEEKKKFPAAYAISLLLALLLTCFICLLRNLLDIIY